MYISIYMLWFINLETLVAGQHLAGDCRSSPCRRSAMSPRKGLETDCTFDFFAVLHVYFTYVHFI